MRGSFLCVCVLSVCVCLCVQETETGNEGREWKEEKGDEELYRDEERKQVGSK